MSQFENVGQSMYDLMKILYPICRSITGDGVRESLKIIQNTIALQIHEIPSGTKIFDWVVPNEWNIHDAFIKNSHGERIVDFQKSNLHIVNYSRPVHRKMNLKELNPYLYTLPEFPDWIPYRTSYYKDSWGFCLTHKQYEELKEDEYEVCIQSSLEKGSLTFGELVIPGETSAEVLISTHVCHPSLCNDNLSGMVLATYLALHLRSSNLRFTYRFLFIPGTIGSIAWLSEHKDRTDLIWHGLVLTGIGDSGGFTYKRTRRGNAEIDRVLSHVLTQSEYEHEIIDFFPYGYDERQYCSPGFNLPVGCLMRTPHGQYPEYHSSGDNLEFIHPEYLEQSFFVCMNAIAVLEKNRTYQSLNPNCEPQLGRRGLYRAVGGQAEGAKREMAMLWILNLSDGTHSLLDIAERANISFEIIASEAKILCDHHLLQEVQGEQRKTVC